jgi:predicted enzyme related to lactoylglutathione lyase
MDRVIGFQVTAKDESVLTGFYRGVFGWGQEPGPHEHVTNLVTGQPGMEGSIIGRGDHIPDYVSLIISVKDLTVSIDAIRANGGGVVRPPFTLPNGETLAIAQDPEGHILTLIESK